MILYYTPGTCALGCMVLLRRTGVPFSVCRVDREQRQQAPYLALNPRGQVPAADVGGGRILTENAAILLHVAARAGAGWLPKGGTPERDGIHFWLAWLASGFHVSFYPFFRPQRYLPDAAQHEAVKEAAKLVIAGAYDTLENHLTTREWMAGDDFSLLDPYVFAMTRWGIPVLGGIDRWPGVVAHRERMLALDEVQWGLGVEQGEIVEADGAFAGHVPLPALQAARSGR